jgi:type IV pilus assembly protein PilX
MKVATHESSLARQRGAVLITALVILFVLTLLGVASMQGTVLEERMAGNFRDRQVAFEAAEAALRVGEAQLVSASSFGSMSWDGTDYTYESEPANDPFSTAGQAISDATLTEETAQPATYFIERLPEVDMPSSGLGAGEVKPKIRYYRITARGSGKTADAEAVLQSTFYRY